VTPSLLDTSVLVDLFRARKNEDRIHDLQTIVIASSVVLSELLRGARNKTERALIERIASTVPVYAPSAADWFESGNLLSQMRADLGFLPEKLRDLHFDVLIALTVRNNQAKLITSNRRDFVMIRQYLSFEMEAW